MNNLDLDNAPDNEEAQFAIGSCQWVHANAAGYVTRSLDTTEMDQVADHLLLCPECDRAMERLGSVVSLAGLVPDLTAPSSDVKSRLFATIAADKTAAELAVASPAESTARPAPRSRWNIPRFATTALLAGALALSGWGIYAQSQMSDQSETISDLERSNEAMATHLGSIQAGQLAFGSGTSTYQLTNVSGAEDDAGGVVVSGDGQTTAVFSVWNMPDGHDSYHVICESELGELLAAGEIVVNDRGTGTVTVNLPSPVSEFRAVHVIPTDSNGQAVADLLTQDILKALMDESAPAE